MGDLPLRPDTLTSPGDLNWLDLIRAEVVIVLAEHLAKLRLGLKVNHISPFRNGKVESENIPAQA